MINILDVMAMWSTGSSVEAIAEEYGVRVEQIAELLRRHGMDRAKRPVRPRGRVSVPSLTIGEMVAEIVREFDEVGIEAGLNGGYVATAGTYTGEERETLSGALASLIRATGEYVLIAS